MSTLNVSSFFFVVVFMLRQRIIPSLPEPYSWSAET